MFKMLPRYVVEAASREYGISVELLRSRTRKHDVVEARHACYFAGYELCVSLNSMAAYLNRDHSTLSQVLSYKTLTAEQRRMVEAVKLTSSLVASERNRDLMRSLNIQVAL